MSLKIHNTLSRKKEVFTPIDPKNVRMYVCGPTVYDYAHIGNARPYVVFDLLFSLLKREYGEDHVTYARNITDIDDKIMARAAKDGKSIEEIADYYTGVYHNDLKRLNVSPPSMEPKATDHLPEMIVMMQKLIDDGYAYEAEGHVLFHVPSMADYGKLSNRSMDEMIAGARVDVAPYKKDPADFVMWKPSTDDQPGWDSPWGRGRPGWHLECSCMIEKHLGNTIDIHAGGVDLVFPHHENEIAQSECAHGETFVKYWMHNGYLTFGGGKMSKSEGNIQTIDGLLEKFGHKGGEALRLTLLSAHYRQPLDFSNEIVKEQIRRLDKWYRLMDGVEAASEVPASVIAALEDDLNTPKALAELSALAKPETAAELKAGANFLGLLEMSPAEWFGRTNYVSLKSTIKGDLNLHAEVTFDSETIGELIGNREIARDNKDFAESDRIRDLLKSQGILLEDGPEGTTWRRAD